MKLYLPLYARIAGWFLLNFVLVAIVLFFFSKQYFSLESLVAGPAGDRITTLAERVGENLRASNEDEWPPNLKRLGIQHQLTFVALRNDGQSFTEEDISLPEAVLHELNSFKAPPGDHPERRGDHRGPPGIDRPGPPVKSDFGPGDFIDLDSTDDIDDGQPVLSHLLFAVQDHNGDYWFANLLQLGRPDRDLRRPHSTILLIKSPTLSAHGLILDSRPWWRLGGIIIGVSILLWLPFAWSISRYIRSLTRRTISIARGNFEATDISHRGDELGHLGIAIDRLRQQLSGYVDGQKRFTSDIAHELCTPLARMQLSLGVLEQQATTSPEMITDLRDEVQQMSSMVDELLDFSRASMQPDKVSLESVDIATLAKEVIEREGASTAKVDIRDKTLAKANPHLLRRALGNAVRNAMHHATGKEILIHTFSTADTLEILIDDQGSGIPEEDLPHIFEPFYRVDSARTREDGGTGLGLAIVGTCMLGCRGTASCENLREGGLRVILSLPLS